MNEKKLISVIMSCFNNEESIQSSVESILNQSYHEFEFLIVDDCSEDNTFEILNYLKSKDERIKLFRLVFQQERKNVCIFLTHY